MRNYHILALFWVLPIIGYSHTSTKDVKKNYIETYAPLAIQEMQRTGIPASVKLAQGIWESRWGQSALSVNSFNHFGIKCKKNWTGKTFYHKDDDKVDGVLVESCFRGYNNTLESYEDHSNFLTSNQRYQWLFTDLDSKDYKGWARGLRKSGYATDKKYSDHIIRIIEEHGLYIYDFGNINVINTPPKSEELSPVMTWQPVENTFKNNDYPPAFIELNNSQFEQENPPASIEILSAPTYNLNRANLKSGIQKEGHSQRKEQELIIDKPQSAIENKNVAIPKPIDLPSERVKSLKRRLKFKVQSR